MEKDLCKRGFKLIKTKKVVLCGLAKSGKTTIRKWLFNKLKNITDTSLHATIEYETHNQIINNTEIVFWDLGGVTAFFDRFVGALAEFVFTGVTTLVFVVDSIELKDIARVKYYLDRCIKRIDQYSPETTVIIFQHKVDLIPSKLREEIYHTTKDYLLKGIKKNVPYYETSLLNSSIVVAMCAVYQATLGYIPNNVIPDPLTS